MAYDDSDDAGVTQMTVRIPPALHAQLTKRKESTGEPLNKMVVDAVAQLIDRPDLALRESAPAVPPAIAVDAIREGPAQIGALKGIGKRLIDGGQVAHGAIIYAAAARLVGQGRGGRAAEARELTRTGVLADQLGQKEVATALFEEAVRADDSELEASSRLGQQLHHQAQRSGDIEGFRRAATLLEKPAEVDDIALLFWAWCEIYVGQSDEDTARAKRGLENLERAMKKWAYRASDTREQTKWMRQLERLDDVPGGTQLKLDLLAFAKANSRWELNG